MDAATHRGGRDGCHGKVIPPAGAPLQGRNAPHERVLFFPFPPPPLCFCCAPPPPPSSTRSHTRGRWGDALEPGRDARFGTPGGGEGGGVPRGGVGGGGFVVVLTWSHSKG